MAEKSGSLVVFFPVLDQSEARAQAFTFCTQGDMCHLRKDHEEKIWQAMKRSINTEYQDLLTHSVKEKVDCESRIVEGDVREEVLNEAKSGRYALVVMGAQGKAANHLQGSCQSRSPDWLIRPS